MKTAHDINALMQKIESSDVDCQWPEEVFDILEQEAYRKNIKFPIKVNLLPEGDFKVIKVSFASTVFEVMQSIAREFGESLLPPDSEQTLDQLFCHGRDKELIGQIEDLTQPIWSVILRHRSRKFGLKLLLVIKVNATWKVAPKKSMSPREIIDLFGMDYTQFTLYTENGADPLPLDTPMELERGECFVAIKDGRYGWS